MMNTVPWSPSLWPAAACAEALAQLGFAPVAGGYQRGEFRLTLGPHWCALEAPCANPGDDLLGDLSQPGLWKHCRADEQPRRVFALPAALVRGAPPSDVGDESAPSVLQRCARWALQTADPFSALDWQAPARAVVESWFAPEQLTVVAGALVRQGELISEAHRLALRFPIVPHLAPGLPPARLAWLRALLEEGQSQWHLARVGCVPDEAGDCVVAEVNLTGAPPEITEDLFVTSLEALRCVLQWLGPPVDWLADVTVSSELLASFPNDEPNKGAT